MADMPLFNFQYQTHSVMRLLEEAESALAYLPAQRQAALAGAIRAFERVSVPTCWSPEDVDPSEAQGLTETECHAALYEFACRYECSEMDWLRLQMAGETVLEQRTANPPEQALQPYQVLLYEQPAADMPIHFHCEAESSAHAEEQALNAYPKCVLVSVRERARRFLEYFVYSASEHHAGDGTGFWSNLYGWVPLAQASAFHEPDVAAVHLPMSRNTDARWVTAAEAVALAGVEQ